MPISVINALRQRLQHIQPHLQCKLCDETSESQRLPICTDCESELPWLGGQCTVCALPLPEAGLICGDCQKQPPLFTHVVAPWSYSFPVDSLINRFKHQAQWPFGHLLAELVASHVQHAFDEGLQRPDLLLAVPLAQQRQRQRGFNQAEMLATWLSKTLDITLQTGCLTRLIDAPAQQNLNAATRKKNLRSAFSLAANAQVQGLHVALVDDVLTTGATAQSICRLLLKAGAARVDVYCLARTAKPGSLA